VEDSILIYSKHDARLWTVTVDSIRGHINLQHKKKNQFLNLSSNEHDIFLLHMNING
jgi:hypothetical protein